MIADYVYCPHCGYEAFDVYVAFLAACANGSFYYCPSCRAETSHVESEAKEGEYK